MFTVDKQQQHRMEQAFYRQLHERCRPDTASQRPLPMVVGIETEYLVVDERGNLASEALRNEILTALPHSSPELGTSTLETHTFPVPAIGAGHTMLQELRRIEQQTLQATHNVGCRLARIGSYPGSFADFGITRQPPRYQQLMDISHALHGIDENNAPALQLGELTLPPQRCTIMSGCQSIHLNLQLPANMLAIHLLNKAIELVPFMVALGAHSALMNSRPTGYEEFRTIIWEPLFTFPNVDAQFGIDTRRTGLPDRYYHDWDDYWQDVGNKLFLAYDVERAFDINMKQFWRTVRLKPCPDSEHDCLLEFRALSTQPTLEEDAAFYLLLVGLLHDPDWQNRPLLPMEHVHHNLEQASRHGLEAHLLVASQAGTVQRQPAAAIAADLLDEARRIWRHTSTEAVDLLDLLRQRLGPPETTPARESLRIYEQEVQAGRTTAEAAHQVLMNYVIE